MRASNLWRDGYRSFFLAFPPVGVVALVLWTLALHGRLRATPAEHGALMLWGVLGLAALGFLFTAYPRQNEASPLSPPLLVTALLLSLGSTGLLLASWVGAPTAAMGEGLRLVLWIGVTAWAARIAWASLRRKWEATTAAVPVALALGAVGQGLAAWGPNPSQGVSLGLHGFLIGLALSLLDRLLPFFSRSVPGWQGARRPWFIPALLAVLALRGLGWGPAWALDLGVLALVARQLYGWQAWKLAGAPMVAVLVVGVGWLVAGYAVDAALGPGPAATHLWTLGGLSTLVFGIATRVTRGHGGLPVALDGAGAAALILVQLAVVLRAVLPLIMSVPRGVMLDGSATLLMLALLVWWIRHAPLTWGDPKG